MRSGGNFVADITTLFDHAVHDFSQSFAAIEMNLDGAKKWNEVPPPPSNSASNLFSADYDFTHDRE